MGGYLALDNGRLDREIRPGKRWECSAPSLETVERRAWECLVFLDFPWECAPRLLSSARLPRRGSSSKDSVGILLFPGRRKSEDPATLGDSSGMAPFSLLDLGSGPALLPCWNVSNPAWMHPDAPDYPQELQDSPDPGKTQDPSSWMSLDVPAQFGIPGIQLGIAWMGSRWLRLLGMLWNSSAGAGAAPGASEYPQKQLECSGDEAIPASSTFPPSEQPNPGAGMGSVLPPGRSELKSLG